jgi:hypothetical protein
MQSMNSLVAAGVIYAFLSYQQNFFNPLSNVMNYMSFFQDGLVAGYRIMRMFNNDSYAPKQNEDSVPRLLTVKLNSVTLLLVTILTNLF